MATAEYCDFYGSYGNEPYNSTISISNDQYNTFDPITTYDNSHVNYYQTAVNWGQYHQPTQYQHHQQHHPTVDGNPAQYNDQTRLHHLQQQPQQQPPTTRFLSPPYSAAYNDHLPMVINSDSGRPMVAAPNPNVPYADVPSVNRSPKSNAKRARIDTKEEIKDSPSLRALLTDRKLRYSPDYVTKKPRTGPRDYQTSCPPTTTIETVALSPIKNEDSLDLADEFATFLKNPMHAQPTLTNQSNSYAYSVSNSSTTSQIHSPMTNFVAGISTPPLSPGDDLRISDASSPEKPNQIWIQNGTEGKNLVFFHCIFSIIIHLLFNPLFNWTKLCMLSSFDKYLKLKMRTYR